MIVEKKCYYRVGSVNGSLVCGKPEDGAFNQFTSHDRRDDV